MSTTARKQILALGVLKHIEEHDSFSMKDASVIQTILDREVAKGAASGLDLEIFEVNPNIPTNMESLRAKLRSKKWDGVTIGGGVRFPPCMTAVFEDAVNIAVEEGTFKLAFPPGPGDIVESASKPF